MKRYSTFSILFFSLALLFAGCNSSSTNVAEAPPALPPSEVMQSDFTLFSDNNPSADVQLYANNVENPYSHFLNASTRALLLNGVINANLFLPASVLTAAEAAEPFLNDDGNWEWNYSVSGNSETFEVSLIGQEQNEGQTTWSVFITNSLLNLDKELLFEGVSSSGNGSGIWTVYQLVGFGIGEPHIQLNWDLSSLTQYSVELDFLAEREFQPVQFIRTERDGSQKRTISRDQANELRADISWNTDTKEGTLVAPDYNDGDRACWDNTFRNIACE